MFVLRITTSHSSSVGFTFDRLRMAEQAHDGALDPDAPKHPPLEAPIQPAQKAPPSTRKKKKIVAARGLNINFNTSVIISKPQGLGVSAETC